MGSVISFRMLGGLSGSAAGKFAGEVGGGQAEEGSDAGNARLFVGFEEEGGVPPGPLGGVVDQLRKAIKLDGVFLPFGILEFPVAGSGFFDRVHLHS